MEQLLSTVRRLLTPGHYQTQTSVNILVSLAIAGGLVAIAARLYLHFYKGYGRPHNTAMAMTLLSLLTCAIIMAIGGNLALSLGMVGALSIVRYRTAVKDMRDLAYLFWAITIGLCCGGGSFKLAIIITGVIAVTIFILETLRINRAGAKDYILIVQSEPGLEFAALAELLPPGAEPRSSVVSKTSNMQEATFIVRLPTAQTRAELETKLKNMEKVQSYHLISPSDESPG